MKYIGTQTYGLKKEFTEDFEGTLCALNQIGFNAVEPLIMLCEEQGDEPRNRWSLQTLREAKVIMDELGMGIPSMHCDISASSGESAEEISEKLLQISREFGVSVFVTSSPVGTREAALETGAYLRKVAAILKANGCQLLFHNHDNEMKKLEDGKCSLDYVLEAAGPDLMLELDFGWAGFDSDELEAAEKYREKVYYIHLKDFFPEYVKKGYSRHEIPDDAFSAVGEGAVRLKEIMENVEAFCHCQGTTIIDQDAYVPGMLKSLEIGMKNVNFWGILVEK